MQTLEERRTVGRRYQRQYYVEHKQQQLEAQVRWITANPEKMREASRRWKQTHREEVARYNRANPRHAQKAEVQRQRRARLSGTRVISISVTSIRAKWAYWGDRCWMCGEPATATDHVKPLAKGGAHMLCNLRPICKSCNSHKKDRWPVNTVTP
jgi:5-methylcytosine-specific restriction endonuclease McrA